MMDLLLLGGTGGSVFDFADTVKLLSVDMFHIDGLVVLHRRRDVLMAHQIHLFPIRQTHDADGVFMSANSGSQIVRDLEFHFLCRLSHPSADAFPKLPVTVLSERPSVLHPQQIIVILQVVDQIREISDVLVQHRQHSLAGIRLGLL